MPNWTADWVSLTARLCHERAQSESLKWDASIAQNAPPYAANDAARSHPDVRAVACDNPLNLRHLEQTIAWRKFEFTHTSLHRGTITLPPVMKEAFPRHKRPVGRSRRLDEIYTETNGRLPGPGNFGTVRSPDPVIRSTSWRGRIVAGPQPDDISKNRSF